MVKKAQGKKEVQPQRMTVQELWNAAKTLFDYKKIDDVIAGSIPKADIRTAAILLLGATLLASIIYLAAVAESIYFAAFSFNAIKDALGATGPEPQPHFEILPAFVQFLLLFAIPATLVLSALQEWLTFHALRLSGGKGAFAAQFYISSLVAVPTSVSFLAILFLPVPCISLGAMAVFVVLLLYFLLYVRCKGYAQVHDISYLHALVVAIVISLLIAAAVAFVSGAVANVFQLPWGVSYNITLNASGV